MRFARQFLASALCAVAGVVASPDAFAQAAPAVAKSDWATTGNFGFFSEYRFRGLTQTNSKPALQGGFDWAHKDGWYLGTWASNVSWLSDLGGVSNSLEWDFYGGHKGKLGNLPYDVGALYYWYPGTYPGGFTNPHTLEVYGALTWNQFVFKYSHALTNSFGFADSKGSGYLDVTGNFELPAGLTLVAHVGRQIVKASSANNRSRSDCSYTDWKLGVTTEAAGLTWGAAYVDTNAKGNVGECYHSANYNKNIGKSTLVLSVSKNF
jgi:uncharacterized protein (TIGR02001 family)